MTQVQKQDWHYKGAACCSPFGTCLLSCCCPCIVYGRTHHRVKNHGNMNDYSCCNCSCAAFTGLLCIGFAWVLPMISRGDIRAKYHLSGNGCKDCMCACCCSPCDLAQQDKESKYREDQRQPLMQQPGKVDQMQYGQQSPQPPAYGHHH